WAYAGISPTETTEEPNKIADETVFHGLPLNTTFSQVRSGVSAFSAHHFSTQENAPSRIFLP
ncbi:MAG: hypothetical protein IKG22_07625, partial [Atopobiaceae bacterium]|nr:hypothetical protein [Atopobiaceae bacterium]